MTKLAKTLLLLPLLIGTARLAAAQASTPALSPPPKTIYVQDFQARTQGDGSSRGGRLSDLRESKARQKSWKSAGSLSGAIVAQFQAAGYTSQRIARDATLPGSGWLVTGVLYALDSKGKVVQMPSLPSSGSPAPNTQVTVSVADLAVDPASPFIVFGTAEALRGQGESVGWNPYVVAAKFVVNKVESSADIQRFAKEIVDSILKNKTTLEEQARAKAR